jgi:23S rRNA pseudouridine955/2504/2580 synthase
MELKTAEDDAGRRLDRILRKVLRNYPLSLIHRLLRQGQILVDGKPGRPRDLVRSGATITIPGAISAPRSPRLSSADLKPHAPGLPPILWQGAGLLILNKPPGLSVHGPGSLDTMVRSYLRDNLPPSLSFRPGPLHRLDKPTSGVIVFSTSLEGARCFSAMMREGRVKKQYLALVEGRVEKEEVWRDDLVRDKAVKKTFIAERRGHSAESVPRGKVRPKTAVTRVSPLAASAAYSLLLAEIASGRTHQIRAQAAARNHPLAGDLKYGGHGLNGVYCGGGFLLHAWKIELCDMHPLPPLVTAPPPDNFRQRINTLFADALL